MEEETGPFTGPRPPRNGYYAGDFWADCHVTAGRAPTYSTVRARHLSHPASEL